MSIKEDRRKQGEWLKFWKYVLSTVEASLTQTWYFNTIVNTNTCPTSILLIKIYLKLHKNTPTCVGHTTIIREVYRSSLKSLLSATCSYVKNWRCGSMSCYVCWVILGERLSVRVIASAVDDGRMTETCRSVFTKF